MHKSWLHWYKSWLHSVQILTIRQPTEKHYTAAMQCNGKPRPYVDGSRDRTRLKLDQRKEMKLTFESHRTSANQTETDHVRRRTLKRKLKKNRDKATCPFEGHRHILQPAQTQKKRLSNIHLSLEVTVWVSRKPLSTNLGDTGHGERHIFTFCSLPSVPQCAVSHWPLEGHRYLREAPLALVPLLPWLVPPLMTHY